MPFTTIAWDESQDTAGVLTLVSAIVDGHVSYTGDLYVVPEQIAKLLGAYAQGATITLAQLQTPNLREILLPDLAPLNVAAVPTPPIPYLDLFENPISLKASEQIAALVAEAAAGAEREIVGAWLGDGPIRKDTRSFRSVRGTSAVALVANAWSPRVMTWTQVFPAGEYEVVGLKAISTTCILARLVFPGYPWRPGVIGNAVVGNVEPLRFRYGNAGVFGRFKHDQPPQVEFLATAADATQEAYLDVVKVS